MSRLGEQAPPRVSVLMPVFNTGKYVREALRSISAQTFGDFELVVIDDGSSDDSAEVLRGVAAEELRMSLVLRENRGLIATRNELVSRARGELIAWMDSDDISMTNRLALQVAEFDADPTLVCLGGLVQCVDPQGELLNIETYAASHEGIVVDQRNGSGMRFPSTMMRREVVKRVGGFREPFRIGEDFDLLLRMGEAGKLANLAAIIYVYRQHMSSVCASLGPQWFAYRDQILELAQERRDQGADRLQRGIRIDIPSLDSRHEEEAIASTYLYWACCALRNGDRRRAWRYAGSSVRARPLSLDGWKTLARVAFAPDRHE